MLRAAALLLFALPAVAADPPHLPPLLSTTGTVHRLADASDCKATVVVFLNPSCPLCQRYAPALNTLYAGRPKGVEFYGVVAHPSVSFAEAAKYAADYKLAFPVLFDGAAALAVHLKPTATPEAFVLNEAGEVVYRGRIDDWYEKPGKPRDAAKTFDLKDAMIAAVAGKKPATAKTEPVGCVWEEELPKPGAAPAKPTYNRHVAALLATRCARCHRDGEVAPFPLLTYADAKKRAKQISRVTADKTMPPWKAEQGFGHFLDEQHLTPAEFATLKAWADAGAPEGDPADKPALPAFADGWQLGKPDLVIKMPEKFTVPAGGKDIIRNFVIPISVPESKMVRAFEFHPGNRKVVHHALCFLDLSGRARKWDEADDGPGYSSEKGGIGVLPTGSLGGWAPGVAPKWLPDGVGRFLAKGSDAVLQVHYHPSGKEETDQSEVGVYFDTSGGVKPLGGFSVESWKIDLPAGEKEYTLKAEYTLPVNTTVYGVAPHMHLLGRTMRAWAELPDGKRVELVNVRAWDFNWQDEYLYRKPVPLPKGAVVKMTSTHDNSTSNPANPNSPPKNIKWGEGTADEMSLCIFESACDSLPDLFRLVADNATHNKVLERFNEPPPWKRKREK